MARRYSYGRRKSAWRGYALSTGIIAGLIALGWWGWGPRPKKLAPLSSAAPAAAGETQPGNLVNSIPPRTTPRDEVLQPRARAATPGNSSAAKLRDSGSAVPGPAAPRVPNGPSAAPAPRIAGADSATPTPPIEAPARTSPTLLEANAAADGPATSPAAPARPQRTQLAADQTGATTAGTRAALDGARRKSSQDPIAARRELNTLLATRLAPSDERQVRDELAKLAEQTVFSSNKDQTDPLVTLYKIEDNDNLQKIGRKFKVPYEVVMSVNGIRDARRIRAGQTLRVPNGPFHAKISKSQFRLDVYLQDTFVRSYSVGLGKDSGTPEGAWLVDNKLPNPTYYPPASAEQKRIVSPNDPKNPLGEHWIGLNGVSGDAKGQDGFGIHGTIDPDSIGKSASLGCVRMHNADVAALYNLLQEKQSTVTTLP